MRGKRTERGSPDPQRVRTQKSVRQQSHARPANRRAAARESRAPELREDAPPYRVAAVGRPPETPDAPREIQRRSTETPLRFIDLFCGIGGFRIAFERAGCECVFSSDWNEQAQITYEANFGEKPHGDIYSVPDNAIPPHHILCAGFPCQPFSIAGVSKKLSLGKKHGERARPGCGTMRPRIGHGECSPRATNTTRGARVLPSSSRWPTSLITTGQRRSCWRT